MAIVHSASSPYNFVSKLLMCLVVTLAIRRTFNFLRIFNALSPIVTMLNNVVWELRIFLTIYFILIMMFSLMYGVIGLGNYKMYGKFRNTFCNMDFKDQGKPSYCKPTCFGSDTYQDYDPGGENSTDITNYPKIKGTLYKETGEYYLA
jgi:hypothetical protein